MIFILSNKEREDKDYEEKYRIGKELFEADMLVIVTPLYYYGMSAQMKTVIAGLLRHASPIQMVFRRLVSGVLRKAGVILVPLYENKKSLSVSELDFLGVT